MSVLSVVVSSKTMKVINLPTYKCWLANSPHNSFTYRPRRGGEFNKNLMELYFGECALLDMVSKDYLEFFNKNDDGVWDIDFATEKMNVFVKADTAKFERLSSKKKR